MSLKTIGTIQQSESEKGDHDKESTKNNVIQTHLTSKSLFIRSAQMCTCGLVSPLREQNRHQGTALSP